MNQSWYKFLKKKKKKKVGTNFADLSKYAFIKRNKNLFTVELLLVLSISD
jgi:hypothetical protein